MRPPRDLLHPMLMVSKRLHTAGEDTICCKKSTSLSCLLFLLLAVGRSSRNQMDAAPIGANSQNQSSLSGYRVLCLFHTSFASQVIN